VRSDAEFAKAHIKGAKHVAMADVEARLKSLTSNTDDAVLVYCNTGNISAKVSRMLIRNGYANVKSLKGGLAAWQEANLPVGTK
jgi:rhodanese-related sulfurtransferase